MHRQGIEALLLPLLQMDALRHEVLRCLSLTPRRHATPTACLTLWTTSSSMRPLSAAAGVGSSTPVSLHSLATAPDRSAGSESSAQRQEQRAA